MNSKSRSETDKLRGAKSAKTREERLKAALKANMARRKAQARARKSVGRTDEIRQGENESGAS